MRASSSQQILPWIELSPTHRNQEVHIPVLLPKKPSKKGWLEKELARSLYVNHPTPLHLYPNNTDRTGPPRKRRKHRYKKPLPGLQNLPPRPRPRRQILRRRPPLLPRRRRSILLRRNRNGRRNHPKIHRSQRRHGQNGHEIPNLPTRYRGASFRSVAVSHLRGLLGR